MQNRSYTGWVAGLMIVWACGTGGAHVVPEAGAETKQVGKMNNAFAASLYARLDDGAGNLFFSPTSVQAALAMTAAGARGNTADEMNKTLCPGGDAAASRQMGSFLRQLNDDGKKGGYELAVANALWAMKGYPFMPAYLSLVQKEYGGRLSDLDFLRDTEGSRKTINDWVAGQTHDKIKDLMPAGSINPNTRLVLTNAIYFKGKWDVPFRKERTTDEDFTAADGRKVRTPIMHQQSHFQYAEDDAVRVVELPYGNDALAMRIVLPKKTDGLAAVEKGLSAEVMSAWAAGLNREDVIVGLPRFTIESGFSLAEVLQAMGMKLAFEPDKADFSGMTSAEKVFISAVIHRAFVRVDEVGTEAAAATGVAVGATAVPMFVPPKVVIADHPFLFAIVHRQSGAILFMGRVEKP